MTETSSVKYHSQDGQDKFVDALLEHKTGGVFVEVGAHDGLNLSNSHFFEYQRGWTGLLVEPNPTVFQLLEVNRPNAIREQMAVSNRDNCTVPFRQLTGYTEVLSGIISDYDPRHEQRIDQELEQHSGTSNVIEVPCTTLDTLLRKHNIDRIDYLSIDTEGSEINVLQGIDWARVPIAVIGVEVNYERQGRAIHELIERTGLYSLVAHVGCDRFYLRNSG